MWLSVAPFGAPVVPEVNWTLIASSGRARAARAARSARSSGPASGAISAKFSIPGVRSSPVRMIIRRAGRRASRRSRGSAPASSGARAAIMSR